MVVEKRGKLMKGGRGRDRIREEEEEAMREMLSWDEQSVCEWGSGVKKGRKERGKEARRRKTKPGLEEEG